MQRALLIAMPAVLLFCAAAAAGPRTEETPTQAGLEAPQYGQAVAAPSPCSGCAGHDCANCPFALAALARAETLPPCPH